MNRLAVQHDLVTGVGMKHASGDVCAIAVFGDVDLSLQAA